MNEWVISAEPSRMVLLLCLGSLMYFQFSTSSAWAEYFLNDLITCPVTVSVWYLSGPENIYWSDSSLLHMASAPLLVYRELLHRVVSDKIQGTPREQALHKILPASYLLMSHWLKQRGWPSPESVKEVIQKVVEMGRPDTLGTLNATVQHNFIRSLATENAY